MPKTKEMEAISIEAITRDEPAWAARHRGAVAQSAQLPGLDRAPGVQLRAQALALLSDALGWRPWLRVGQLTSERDILTGLQEDYGAEFSRTPVREGLAILARDGFIEQIPQRGIRVRSVSAADAEASLDLISRMELTVGRTLAERRAARELDDGTLGRLDGYVNAMTDAREEHNPLSLLREESTLHGHMAALAGYPRAAAWISTWRDELRLLMIQTALPSGEEMDEAIQINRELVDAVGVGDGRRAEQSVERYLDACRQRVQARAG